MASPLPLLALLVLYSSCMAFSVSAKKDSEVKELQIGVKFKPKTCEIQAHKGDTIKVHYRGTLVDGTEFDSSYTRGDPIEFELGAGHVIKGWDQGLLGMCVGEKRKLKIPSKLGYGAQGSPPKIPGGATLIFDTELVAVNGKRGNGLNCNSVLLQPILSGSSFKRNSILQKFCIMRFLLLLSYNHLLVSLSLIHLVLRRKIHTCIVFGFL
ncbi:hypothetical protein GOP47_0012483 [Adiantum capillus-veneris]|uniref:peptidylprolyl isomerase n=2 Tax=Euphyllophyta TaxID=78536 RepID=A0A9D4UR99_ADICA|nr:hypothetical protein GOP47_0012483 [Adiantum capillus-veneris]